MRARASAGSTGVVAAPDGVGAATLREAVRGVVVLPGDAGYDDARRVNNAAVDRRPTAIVQAAGPADIAAVLDFARSRHLSISVRSGGHGVTGAAVAGDIVVDLRALCGVRVDADRRTVTVGGGTTWAALDSATVPHRLALPGSRAGSTGVAGFCLGGGLGWLSSVHGLAADNLMGAELVLADGTRISTSAEVEPELFWALRGGGAPGVLTGLTFRLGPLPPHILAGLLLYPAADLPDVLATLAELRAADPVRFAGAAMVLAAPPKAFVPGDVVGRPVVAVMPTWLSDGPGGATFLAPLRQLRPLADTVAPMSYLDLQSLLAQLGVHSLAQRWAAAVVPGLSDAVLCDLDRAAAELADTHRQVLIAPMPDRPAGSLAAPRHRPSWLVHAVAAWRGPTEAVAASEWLTDLTSGLQAHGDLGTWPDLDSDLARRRAAFGRTGTERLGAVRATWDSDDVFTCSNPIASALPRA